VSASLLVDHRPLTNAHARRGIGRFVHGLTPFSGPQPHLVIREVRAWSPPRARRSSDGIALSLPPRPRMRLDPLGALLVRARAEDLRPDIVHLQDPYGHAWAPRDARLLLNVYDLLQLESRGRLPDLFRRGLATGIERKAHWLTISDHVASQLVSEVGIAAHAITVVPPGPTAWPAHEPVIDDVALVIGALDEHKRPDHALAAARHANVPLRFLGRHDPALVERWGIESGLEPDLDDSALAGRIAGARAVVHASRAEGFGLPVLEALSLGTPVVAYDLDVTREVVGPDYPLVDESAGPEGLGRLLAELGEPGLRRDVLESAKPALRRFDWAASRTRLSQLYESLS
jgi:glycosyltransferase involved in cell wall biosynthesis